jgi:hypothetical protein
MNLVSPIPGMSLTKEPGNAPYEQPPLYNTAEEALAFYFAKLDDEENLDDILFALDEGVPLEGLVDSMTSVGAMEGYHSVDVKILISPPLHEYISSLADAAGVEYVEEMGPSKEERMQTKEKERLKILMKKALESGAEPSTENVEDAEAALEESPAPFVPRRK